MGKKRSSSSTKTKPATEITNSSRQIIKQGLIVTAFAKDRKASPFSGQQGMVLSTCFSDSPADGPIAVYFPKGKVPEACFEHIRGSEGWPITGGKDETRYNTSNPRLIAFEPDDLYVELDQTQFNQATRRECFEAYGRYLRDGQRKEVEKKHQEFSI